MKRSKYVISISLFVISCISLALCVQKGIALGRVVNTIPNGNCATNFDVIVTSRNSFYDKYNSIEEKLSGTEDFIDLIPKIESNSTVKTDNDEISTSTIIFYQGLFDDNYASLTEGRNIDTSNVDESNIEIMLSDDIDASVGDQVDIRLGYFNEDNKYIILNAVVVGKYHQYVDFPLDSTSGFSSYLKTGKYPPTVIIPNIVNLVDFNNDEARSESDYKDDYQVVLLPTYKEKGQDYALYRHELYEIAEQNSCSVVPVHSTMGESFYIWNNNLNNKTVYLVEAILLGLICIISVITMIFFCFIGRKNDKIID